MFVVGPAGWLLSTFMLLVVAACHAWPGPQMNSNPRLEDDRCGVVVDASQQTMSSSIVFSTTDGTRFDKSSLPDDSLIFTFFGKPVEGSLAHHTILGQPLQRFDFLVQPFMLVEAEWNETTKTWTSVALVQHGDPLTCRLSHIPYETLSKTLSIWTSCQSGYKVCLHMSFGCAGYKFFTVLFIFAHFAQVQSSYVQFNVYIESATQKSQPQPRPRPVISSDLLLAMAVAGAFWQHGHPFFVDPEVEGLDLLLDHGIAWCLVVEQYLTCCFRFWRSVLCAFITHCSQQSAIHNNERFIT